MKYVIEIAAVDNGDDADPLSRTIVDAVRLEAVKSKAVLLLKLWVGNGATSTRVLLANGDQVHLISRDQL